MTLLAIGAARADYILATNEGVICARERGVVTCVGVKPKQVSAAKTRVSCIGLVAHRSRQVAPVNSTDAVGSGKRSRSEGAETGHFVRDQGLRNYPGCLMAVSITLASFDDAMAARSVSPPQN